LEGRPRFAAVCLRGSSYFFLVAGMDPKYSAKTSKELYDLANGELFDSTIQDLLMFKCRFDESKRQKMYDICFKIVGKELLESGLLKSLQSES
jgi:hypothetical protein